MCRRLGIGLLGLVVLVVVVAALSGGGGGRDRAASSSTPAAAATSGKAVVAAGSEAKGGTETGKSVTAPKPTEVPKPTEGPRLGSSRSAPVPFGQPVTVKRGNGTFQLTVLEVVRDATELVKEANQFNDDPEPGMAYVAIKMRMSYLDGPVDKPYSTPSIGESLFARSRMWGERGITVAPSPQFGGIDIYPRATVDGWLTPIQVPADALDEVLLSWGKDLFGGGEVWFALEGEKADAGPPPVIAAPPAPTSPKPGAARGSPVLLGEAAVISEGKARFAVSVVQVERNASALVRQANMFNPEPKPGMEYIAVKVRLEYLEGPEDEPVTTQSLGSSVFAQNRMWGAGVMVVEPKPALGGQDIYPGAVVEGWLPPVMLPEEAMDEAILSYGKDLFGGGETWFALK